MKEVLESSSKEAMYAMDDTNPLRLFDCLIPEITAYRPMKIFRAKKKADNFDALYKLKEKELAIVSALIRCIYF